MIFQIDGHIHLSMVGDIFRDDLGIKRTEECVQHRGVVPVGMCVTEIMTHQPKRISDNARVTEAIEVMRKFSIDELPVVGDDDVLCGLIDIQDLLARGFSLMNTP